MRRRRLGGQEPTFATVGGWAYTDGDYAAKMYGEYGVAFYASQRLEMRVFLARREDGSYSATTICVSKPRQNGKSFAARFYATWMAAIEGRHVLYSAHHGKTVRKMFKEIRNFVESTPDFAAMLKPNGRGVYAAAGSEGVYFVDEEGRDAGLIEFQTRTASAARGETYHVIIVDEAQELTDEQLEAIKPTTLAASDVEDASSDPQMIYLGTPPRPKCPGTVFRDLHDRAHAGEGGSAWWMEWAADEVPDMSDRRAVMELVYRTNPAMGHRIKESSMLDAMDTMRPDGFARECLGWWSESFAGLHPIDAEDWAACKVDDPPDDPPSAYAVKFSPDGLSGSLAACVVPAGGPPYVEVVANRSLRRGVGWFADWLAERADRVEAIVVDGRANAQTLNDGLVERGVDPDVVFRPTTAEMIAACSALVDATKPGEADARGVGHYGQPALDASATLSGKRRIGADGGFGFDSNENADATLVEACALAFWKAREMQRDQPATEMRMG